MSTWDPETALANHAMQVLADPASTPDDRDAAEAHLLDGLGDVPVDNLDPDDLFELERILRSALRKPPAPPRPPPCTTPPATAIAAPCPRCASLGLGVEDLDALFARLRARLADEPDDDPNEVEAELLEGTDDDAEEDEAEEIED